MAQETAKCTKTIEVVFEEFIQEQEERLAPKTLKNYEDVLYLFKDSLNTYAYLCLDEEESALFDKFFKESGEKHKDFCGIFGPEKILENVDEFVNYFMVRKVICSKEVKKATGIVIKKLGKWLLDKKYITSEDSEEIVEIGKMSATDLPASDDFLHMLIEHFGHTALPDTFDNADIIQGKFEITAIKPGKLYLSSWETRGEFVVTVPQYISKSGKTGWCISGSVGKKGKTMTFAEVWNVYP